MPAASSTAGIGTPNACAQHVQRSRLHLMKHVRNTCDARYAHVFSYQPTYLPDQPYQQNLQNQPDLPYLPTASKLVRLRRRLRILSLRLRLQWSIRFRARFLERGG